MIKICEHEGLVSGVNQRRSRRCVSLTNLHGKCAHQTPVEILSEHLQTTTGARAVIIGGGNNLLRISYLRASSKHGIMVSGEEGSRPDRSGVPTGRRRR